MMLSAAQLEVIVNKALNGRRRYHLWLNHVREDFYARYGGIGPDFDLDAIIAKLKPFDPMPLREQAEKLQHRPAANEGGRGADLAGRCGVVDASPSASPTNGFWANPDWLFCRDGRWRPVEPGTFPLAHGSAARVGRLRGYGNAIVAVQAQAFIEAYRDATGV